MIKAIVFDMDDTLYPESAYVLSGFRQVANWAETTLDIPAEEGYAAFKRLFDEGVRGKTFNEWLQHFDRFDKALIPAMVDVYRAHDPEISPFPSIPTLLARLHGRYKIGLVSDGYLEVQQRKFAALGLQEYFDAVVFSDQFGRDNWKPSSVPFVAVLEQLASNASETVYVADNVRKDFLGARRVGMYTVWLREKGGIYYDSPPPSPEYAPHVTIASLDQLESSLSIS